MDEKFEDVKILLCEDDENLGMLLREYLEAKGYKAELCIDGEAGYKAFKEDKFDLCILDVMMPKMDGFTLATKIRESNSEIPLRFLSCSSLQRLSRMMCWKDSRSELTTISQNHSRWKRSYSESKPY